MIAVLTRKSNCNHGISVDDTASDSAYREFEATARMKSLRAFVMHEDR